ncbi:LTA synthase family protein [Anaerotignum faecicola]
MKKLREIRTKTYAFVYTHKPAAFIMWLLVLLFPLWLSLSGNAISFLSGEDGAVVLLRTLLTENYGAFLLGMLLIYLFFGAMVCLWKHVPLAALLTGLIFTIMPTVDFLKTEILKEHFLPWDMLLAKNADSFTTFLSALKIPTPLWWLWGGTVAYLAVLAILRPTLPIAWKKRVLGAPILLGCLYLCTMNGTVRADYSLLGLSSEAPTDQTKNYTENGFLTAFVLNLSSLNMGDPDNYSERYLEKAFAQYQPDEASGADFQNPDVIVILSESFWDPTTLKNVSFTEDPIPNYRRILAENHGGSMVSCTFGGGTVRPEFEILTGMTTSMLPSGNVPYQQYVFNNIYSYAREFKNQGYDTIGIHTYQKEFYERDRAYPLLGFDEMLGEYDLHAEQHFNSGPFLTDESLVEEIMYQLEQPHEKGVFIQGITMENHGLYLNKFDPSEWNIDFTSDTLSEEESNLLHNYCKGVSDSDAQLGRLYEYVMNREKPTVVLWYGDHLPTLGNDFGVYASTGTITSTTAANWTEEEKYQMFSTPYVVFSNYDTGHEYRADSTPVSPYLLTALMYDYIGAPETLRSNFLLDLYAHCPVISPYYNLYSEGCDEETRNKYIKLHELLTYDDLMGEQYLTKKLLPQEQKQE